MPTVFPTKGTFFLGGSGVPIVSAASRSASYGASPPHPLKSFMEFFPVTQSYDFRPMNSQAEKTSHSMMPRTVRGAGGRLERAREV